MDPDIAGQKAREIELVQEKANRAKWVNKKQNQP